MKQHIAILVTLVGLIPAVAQRPAGTSSTADAPQVTVTRLKQNPLITVETSASLGDNIDGPTVIRVPDWVERPSRAEADRMEYRGFVVDVTTLKSSAERPDLIKALERQFDMVADAGFDKRTLEFFRAIPIVVNWAATADPNYTGVVAEYNPKSPRTPKPDVVPGSVTIVLKVYNPGAPIVLHEFLHAYHHERMTGGRDNAEILQLFKAAQDGQLFPADSKVMTNAREYFAMTGSVYLHGSANRDPFTRENLKNRQPAIYQWFVKEFGPR
jgi:hypothetical protein